jgi:hypothetical protein
MKKCEINDARGLHSKPKPPSTAIKLDTTALAQINLTSEEMARLRQEVLEMRRWCDEQDHKEQKEKDKDTPEEAR